MVRKRFAVSIVLFLCSVPSLEMKPEVIYCSACTRSHASATVSPALCLDSGPHLHTACELAMQLQAPYLEGPGA